MSHISDTMTTFKHNDDSSDDESCDEGDDRLWKSPLSALPWEAISEQSYNQRYQCDRKYKVARALERIAWLFSELDEGRFVQEVRMSKEAFFLVLGKMKDHSIFASFGNKPQRPVYIQMLVTLRRLGYYGNGASVGSVARYFGVSG